MDQQETLYPYELLSLLEALYAQAFTGRVILRREGASSGRGSEADASGDAAAAEERAAPTADSGPEASRTEVHIQDGRPRYATTTEIAGSFPAFLISEGVFTRSRVRRWTATCTEEGRPLEEYLLSRRRIDAEGLMRLKGELSQQVLARALAHTATAEIAPARGDPPDFGDLTLDPYEGLFQSVAETPVPGAVLEHFQGNWQRPIRRGPDFFVLLPTFRRWFPETLLPGHLDEAPTLTDLTRETDADSRRIVLPLFAMHKTGMAHFDGERTRPARLLRAPSRTTTGRPTSSPPSQGTDPGIGPEAAPSEPARVSAEPSDGLEAFPEPEEQEEAPGGERVPPPPPPAEEEQRAPAPERFADLHGDLIVRELEEAAAWAEGVDDYALLGLPADAPLSAVREAFRRARRRYDEAQYQGYFLPPEALARLRRLQKRIEEAYDRLTDLRARREHDLLHEPPRALTGELLEAMFYAEGVFKAAQIRMAREAFEEAVDLLDEAIVRFPYEPEFRSYRAWALHSASLRDVEIQGAEESPRAVLEHVLSTAPHLESAWLFRARIEEVDGDSGAARAAYEQVLRVNPDNDEAIRAAGTYREEGIEARGLSRPSLRQRLARVLRGGV